MSILSREDVLRRDIQLLKQTKETIRSVNHLVPGMIRVIMSIDEQILDYETKLEQYSIGKITHQCSRCLSKLTEAVQVTIIQETVICERCIKTMHDVMTTTVAEENAGMKKGAIRQDIFNGVLQPYIDAGLVWKSGNNWQIHRLVLELHYAKSPERKRGRRRAQPTTLE